MQQLGISLEWLKLFDGRGSCRVCGNRCVLLDGMDAHALRALHSSEEINCFASTKPLRVWLDLGALASALVPVVEDQSALQEGLKAYADCFNAEHHRMNADKLGFAQWREEDAALLRDLYQIMEGAQLDFTLSFRALMGEIRLGDLIAASDAPARVAQHQSVIEGWLARYQARSEAEDQRARMLRMQESNPIYLPRNYLAQLAIDAAEQGDVSVLHEWMEVLKNPYTAQAGKEKFAAKRPDWARERAGCSMLSCSS
jgi:serine/tyrosine/threonine adenylyltransferase